MLADARRVALLLFGSGFCALVYQIVWLRELRLVFGTSTAASAAVLAVFIGGLGVGSLLIGPRADRHPSPLGLYARLETWIALSAAVTPALLWLVRQSYVAAGGTAVLGPFWGTTVRLLLSALVLAVPTGLMGGTLPAAARAVSAADDRGRRGVALLYGVNTLGAFVGAFLATFFMLEVFGNRKTLWLGCLLNLLVVMAARQMARKTVEKATPAPVLETGPAAPPALVLVAAGVVGFAFFLMELVWYRMLGPILGGTVFTFGLILAVALLGVGLGGAAYSLVPRTRPPRLSDFASTCLLEALLIALPLGIGDGIAVGALVLRQLGDLGLFWGHVAGWTAVCFVVVLPPALVAGYQFPMLIGLLGSGRTRVGRQTGLAYASNTAGAIVGSLAGGFGLMPLLSAPGVWRMTAALLLLLGGVAWLLTLRVERAGVRAWLAVPTAVLVLLMLAAPGPTAAWRHSTIGAGRAEQVSSREDLEDWLRQQRRKIRWEADGVESSVALQATNALAFVINGKVDGNCRSDASTQVMAGLLGALLHPQPTRSLVIGLGSGSTAGWLGVVPGMESTDVVELEEVVLRVAGDCAAVNQNVLDNPAVHIGIGDAREMLLVSREQYDIIFSEPSNPYRAGIASLFTREFYEAVARRLGPHGLFLQWVQAYEVEARTVRTIYATLGSVFPEVQTWHVGPNDLLLIGSMEPVMLDAALLRQRLRQEPFRSAMGATWRTSGLEGMLTRFVAGPGLARAVARKQRGPLNSDDQNSVEFGFARSVGQAGSFTVGDVREAAVLRGEHRPPILNGEVDWARVQDGLAALYPSAAAAPAIHRTFDPSQERLAQVFARFLAGDGAAALAVWRTLGREPRTTRELLVVSSIMGGTGDEATLPYIEELGHRSPVEADAMLAWLRTNQGRTEEAVEALERALVAYRTDPWPTLPTMSDTLRLTAQIGTRDPAFSPRLLEALQEPFAVYGMEEGRLDAMARLLSDSNLARSCRRVLEQVEPNVPWTATWLNLRRDCYTATGDPRAADATRDLARFNASRPSRFQVGLVPTAMQPPSMPSPAAAR